MKARVSTLTNKMKKEIAVEARKQMNELIPFITQYVESIILWQLHEQYGFGEKRLKKFFDATAPMMNAILTEYNWQKDEDAIWYCKYKLKSELGIDLENTTNPFNVEINLE